MDTRQSGTHDSVKDALYINVNGSAMVLKDAFTSFASILSSPYNCFSENKLISVVISVSVTGLIET